MIIHYTAKVDYDYDGGAGKEFKGVAFGESVGNAVDNIIEYYGTGYVDSITITLEDDYEGNVTEIDNT